MGHARIARRNRGGEGARPEREAGHRTVRGREVQRPLPRERVRVQVGMGAVVGSDRVTGWITTIRTSRTANDYVETVWWLLAPAVRPWAATRGHKVLPYCPRCGTVLSSHELALGYGTSPPAPSTSSFRSWTIPPANCWSGRRRRGRSCPTSRSPSIRTSVRGVHGRLAAHPRRAGGAIQLEAARVATWVPPRRWPTGRAGGVDHARPRLVGARYAARSMW